MRVDDVMIGDWVHIKNGRNLQLELDQFYAQGCHCFKGDIIDYFESFETITLTAEILEKNGFEKDEEMNFVIRGDDFFINLWIMPLCIEFYFTSYYDTNEMRINIDYVHELQQALRLVGLNDFANNFKI